MASMLSEYLTQGWAVAVGWASSPAAWSQFALLLAAWLISTLVSRKLGVRLSEYLKPDDGATGLLPVLRRFLLRLLPLLLPLLAYGFAAIGESVTRSLFGSGTVIAFGKRVFLALAARILVTRILREPFLRLLGRYVLM
ncbi:MAG: mechanosensitive ion channel protein MscS, partial [Paracoccaceae bacterium]